MPQASAATGLEVAVIGMAARFPGADNLDEFWSNLLKGREAIRYYTNEELRAAGVSESVLNHQAYVPTDGAVIEDKKSFDPHFFRYTPQEAAVMEPQMRLFHEYTWKALEDAGYDPYTYPYPVGLYAGAAPSLYWQYQLLTTAGLDFREYFAIEHLVSTDYLCTTVSHKLNLTGPSIAIQTACSTSLVAVHLACQGLLGGDCEMAVAGGVFLTQYGKRGYIYQPGLINSADGHCRAFDDKSTGCIGGEGIGLLVLKRLADALRDGDSIHAVIKGSAVNNDGSNKVGFTAPAVTGQQSVIEHALEMAEVPADSLHLVETHGTGTELGDPVEIEALSKAFGSRLRNHCAIGALKPNIGHLGNAAGVASLIKAILCLKHKVIPPVAHFESPNRRIDLQNTPFYIPTVPVPLEDRQGPLRASVSSFGIGGTNAYVVLEGAPAPRREPAPEGPHLLLLSARGTGALADNGKDVAAFLEQRADVNLADVAYTLQVGRAHFEYRGYAVCHSPQEAAAALRKLTLPPEGKGTKPAKPVFLFPGQGSQYPGMGEALYHWNATFRQELDNCLAVLATLGLEVRSILFPGHPGDPSGSLITETCYSQPILFAFEYALARMLMSWGVVPHAMAGHSIGEYAAACIAGVFSLPEALALVKKRGELMQKAPRGVMLAVQATPQAVRPYLTEGVSLAAVNGPENVVLAGSAGHVEQIRQLLEAKAFTTRRLHTSHAFHSCLMESVLDEYRAYLREIQFREPRIPMVSNLTGDWVRAGEITTPDYWVQHLRNTVLFGEGLAKILALPDVQAFEVGPGNTLAGFVKQAGGPARTVAGLVRHAAGQESGVAFLLGGLGKAWQNGVSVQWQALYGQYRPQRIALPTYRFEHREFWPDFAGPARLAKPATLPAGATPYYARTWKMAPAGFAANPGTGGANCLVLANSDEFSAALVLHLERLGNHVIQVFAGAGFERTGQNQFTVDPTREETFGQLAAGLAALHPTIDCILHCWHTLGPGHGLSFEALQARGVLSLHALASHIMPAVRGNATLYYITDHAYRVVGNEPVEPAKATALGGLLVACQEIPNLQGYHIDVDYYQLAPSERQKMFKLLMGELALKGPDRTIAFRSNTRWLDDYVNLPLPPPAPERPGIKSNGTYLITGGLGRVGLHLAHYLAKNYRCNLVLTGKSAFSLPPEWDGLLAGAPDGKLREQLAMLVKIRDENTGLLVRSADVTSPGEMAQVFEEAELRYGRVDGVIHAAGAVDHPSSRTLLRSLTRTDFMRQFGPKIQGTQVLAELVRTRPGCSVILMSSLSTSLGGLGLGAYAAANCYLDSLCCAMQHADNPWYSISWDGWSFPAAGSPEGNGQYVPAREGPALLDTILAQDTCRHVVVTKQNLFAQLNDWVKNSPVGPPAESVPSPAARRGRPALDSAYVPPRDPLEERILRVWEEFFGIGPLGVHDDFFDLGGDSLKGMRLVNKYQELLRENVYVSMIFEAPTVEQTARYFRKHYQQALAGLPGNPVGAADAGAAGELDEEKLARLRSLVPKLSPVKLPGKIQARVVFILSPSRSGSTLLRVMLGGHSQLFAPPELDILSFSTLQEKNTSKDGCIQALMTLRDLGVNQAKQAYEAYENQGLTVHEFYERLTTELAGRILVDKSPDYVLNPEVLQRALEYFERPYFIHLTRHPYGTIHSKEKAKLDIIPAYLESHLVSGREFAEAEWVIGHQNILRLLQTAPEDRQVRISFEELVKNPARTMERLCRFLDVPFQPEMLEPYKERRKRMTDGIHKEGIMIGDPKFHSHQSIDPHVADAWREAFADDFLSKVTWELAARFGYGPVRDNGYASVKPAEQKEYYSLSQQQRRMYFLQAADPGSITHNLPQLIRLKQRPDPAQLADVFAALLGRHEILRTSFQLVDHVPVQRVHPAGEVSLELVYHETTGPAGEPPLHQFVKPFDLARAPLCRAFILNHSGEFLLLIDKHHIIADGTSRIILEKDFSDLLQGKTLAEKPLQYKDFVAWRTATARQQAAGRQRAFWLKETQDWPARLQLPGDVAGDGCAGSASTVFRVEGTLFAAARDYCRAQNVTLNVFCVSIFSLLLNKLSGQEDVVFGTVVSGRNHKDLENIVGMFVNTLVVRTRVDAGDTFAGLLASVRKKMLEVYDHQDYPFEEVAKQIGAGKKRGSNSVFDVLFIYENLIRPEGDNPAFETTESGYAATEFGLTLVCREWKDALACCFTYRTETFAAEAIDRYTDYFNEIIGIVLREPATRIREVRLAPAAGVPEQPADLEIPDFNF